MKLYTSQEETKISSECNFLYERNLYPDERVSMPGTGHTKLGE